MSATLREYRKRIDAQRSERRASIKMAQLSRANLDAALTANADALEAQKIAQLVAQTVQTQAHTRIAGVVTRCLASVFEEPYEFKINFEQKRGKTEASLVFVKDGNEFDPMTSTGGGVVDVASFALRLAALLLRKPRLQKVLVLDEPLKFVSQRHRERCAQLFVELSKELGVQIVMVTHVPEFEIGKVVRL